MSSMAIKLCEQFLVKAKERMEKQDFSAWSKKAKGDLEPATALGLVVLLESGLDLGKAAKRMLEPELGLLLETSADRAMASLYAAMDYDMMIKFNKQAIECLDFIVHDSMGHFAMWTFEDGSAWVTIKGHDKELAWDALKAVEFSEQEVLSKDLWTMWGREYGVLGMAVGAKFLAAKKEEHPFVALTQSEAKAMVLGLAKSWAKEPGAWGKGLNLKALATGSAVNPSDFEKMGEKALDKGREDQLKIASKRLDAIKKERDARMKIHWRDAMCVFLSQAQALPIYDAGFASFLMTKPGLFGQYPLPVWRKMFFEIVDMIKHLPEGDSPDLDSIESAASILGSDVSSQLAHFLYRYHRLGGAKLAAKRVLEHTKDRMAIDSAKQGLAAAVKSKDPISDEMREASKSASSVEFSAQFGSALALYTSIWAKETGFGNISIQAKAFVKTMRGAGEISMECFGWFARLMYEFGEGFIDKETIVLALKTEMDLAAKIADEEKRVGGKITIENEWSGNWGAELGTRKVREYLGLEKAK